MPDKPWFLPGRPGEPSPPLARYRPSQPKGTVEAYTRALTEPGDLVIDLFCQGSTAISEVVSAGRRALGRSVNLVLLEAAKLGLIEREPEKIKAAFTHLADSPKGDVPLRHHLTSLYHSTCPMCGQPADAEWLAWDRAGGEIIHKRVRCPVCGGPQEGPPDDVDRHTAQIIQPQGLAYYYALDRVTPPGHPARERAAELVDLYTPRNLSALMDLTRRLESLEIDENTRTILTAALLECFDAGSKLDAYEEKRPRPRRLHVPATYVERNVWFTFAEQVARLSGAERSPVAPRVETIDQLQATDTPSYLLTSSPAHELGDGLAEASVSLMLVDPSRPDGVFWALSALWAGWLWESPSVQTMSPFLRRRRFDWDWHWRALRQTLKAVRPLLAPQAFLVTLFVEMDEALLESVCLATASTGYDLQGWGYSAEVGHRLIWTKGTTTSSPPIRPPALNQRITACAEQTTRETIQARREPTDGAFLRTTVYAELVQQNLFPSVAAIPEEDEVEPAIPLLAEAVDRGIQKAAIPLGDENKSPLRPLWLIAPDKATLTKPVLADRVEAFIRERLLNEQAWDLQHLVNAVYGEFSGPLTPDLMLVMVCIDSYTTQEDHKLSLRLEDVPQRRHAQMKELRRDLTSLGERLAFRVKRRKGWDVRWLEEGREVYVFAISSSATLGPHLLHGPSAPDDTQRCLILPEARAQLVHLKLRRDPRLAQALDAEGWQFIKFRHVRRLLDEEEDLHRHALKTVLGLDPIVEKDAAQIPLF